MYDEAMARVRASRPGDADAATYSSEELFPYAVQVAMELGVEATAMRPITSVQGWLARVRVALQAVLSKLTGNPQAFDGQDLVDLAFAVAQQESAAPVQALNDAVGASPSLPTWMSRQAGRGSVGAATAGSLGTAKNPRPIPFNPEHIKVLTERASLFVASKLGDFPSH